MGTPKRVSAILALAVLMVATMSSITLGNDSFNPPGGGSTDATQCVSPSGVDGVQYDPLQGNPLAQVGGPDHYTVADIWWRADTNNNGDSPEWHGFFPAQAFNSLRPDILVVKVWVYPTSTCSPEQAMLQFENHVNARLATGNSNIGGALTYEQLLTMFQPVAGSTYVAPDPGTQPGGVTTSGGFDDDYSSSADPATQPVVNPDGSVDPTVDTPVNELCADEFTDELSEQLGVDRNNRDACNPYADDGGECVIGYERYPLDRLPELSNSGAGNIFTVRRSDQTLISWFPHGRVTFQPGPQGKVWDAGIYCTFEQIMGWINQNMARVGATQYVDWQDLRFLNLDTYNIPGGYYGGTEDPDNATDCRPIGEKRIFEQIRKGYIDASGYYIHGSPWVSGVSKERQVVIRPLSEGQQLHWDSNVQGSVRLYPADRCDFDQVMEQARVHHNARGKAHSALVVKNWREDDLTSRWFSIR